MKISRKIISNKGEGLLRGRGKDYSAVAIEMEQTYQNWLTASEISEEVFLNMVDREDFYLTFYSDDEMALVSFRHTDGEIAMPLTWQKGNGIAYEAYKTDAGLLLFLVAGKCENPISKEKIENFTKNKLFAE